VTTASATDAIDINIGASDVVNLRGLTLVGGGIGTNGIAFSNLGALNIQNCVIRGFTNDGVALHPSGTAVFDVSDTIVSNIVVNGVEIQPSGSGTVLGVFNRVQASGDNISGFAIDGFNSTGAINVTIANSTVSNNPSIGIFVGSAAANAKTQVMVVNSVVANNGTGVFEDGAN
jgi:hypothetical protein